MLNLRIVLLVLSLCCLCNGQATSDDPGVTVDLGGAVIMHRTPVFYPDAARLAGIEGTVALELSLDSVGTVADARALSGLLDLRRGALESVLAWHFRPASNLERVRIAYQSVPVDGSREPFIQEVGADKPDSAYGKRLKEIAIVGVSYHAWGELRAQLPVREGDVLTPELVARAHNFVRVFDDHLSTRVYAFGDLACVDIVLPGSIPPNAKPLHEGLPVGGTPGGVLGGIIGSVPTAPPPLPPYAARPKKN